MNLKIGISIGDINGIGPEVIIKALSRSYLIDEHTIIIYGSSKVVSYHKNITTDESFSFVTCHGVEQAQQGKINVINCWQDAVQIELGQSTEASGKAAYIALDKAVTDLVDQKIDALVTAPIHKAAMKMADFPFLGHTEYICDKADGNDYLMLLSSDTLRVGLVTTHIPIEKITENISEEIIFEKIELLDATLKEDLGIERPLIAVLGLNPHAGDQGEIGTEDQEVVLPAILQAKEKGIMASGPYPADGFFGNSMHSKFDAILAMYHDQGLIPFKTLSFGDGVNYTAGLSVVRTSPDHGTAYDIAGKNIANPDSFRQALYQAIDIVRNRKEFEEIVAHSIDKLELEEEENAE